jgi:hypothetical protein
MNGIGEYGVRQLSQSKWPNLSKLTLSNTRIIRMTMKLEIQDASG